MVRWSFKVDSIVDKRLVFILGVNGEMDEPIKEMGKLMAFNHNQEYIRFFFDLVPSS